MVPMRMKSSSPSKSLAVAAVAIGLSSIALAQNPASTQKRPPTPPRPARAKVEVERDGTVHTPSQAVPVSTFLSDEARRYVIRQMTEPVTRGANDETGAPFAPLVQAQRNLFAVEMTTTEIGGVKTL